MQWEIYWQIKKRMLTRCTEYQQDSMSGKWESSGSTEHKKECYEQFDWLHPKTVRTSPCLYERKICRVLEIKKLRTINENENNLIYFCKQLSNKGKRKFSASRLMFS